MVLSVIIPIYNASLYLENCLDSLIGSKGDFEILLINDGSTDNSAKICKEYKVKDARIKYFEKENSGVSATRNLGIERASGEFLCFVDADDYMSEDWYDKISNRIDTNTDVLIFSNSTVVDYNKENILDNMFGVDNRIQFLGTPWSKIFKTSIIKDNKVFFDTRINHGEDLLFNYEVFLKAQNIELVNESIYCYRINATSATHNFNPHFIDSDRLFHEKYKEIYMSNNCFGKEYSEYNLGNAIKLIVYKVSLTKDLKKSNLLKCFQTEPYLTYIRNNKTIFNFLAELRFYKLLIIIYIIKNSIRRKKETIIEV